MPSVEDVVEIAQSLRDQPVGVVDERCVSVRNRNSQCRRCSDACVADAIAVHDNAVKLDLDACMACGACTAVCPTEALVPLEPTDEQLADAVVSAVGLTGEREAVVGCARIASKLLADPRKFAEVPCLCRVDATFLLTLLSKGFDVVLVDGTCKTCKYRDTQATTDATVDEARRLASKWGGSARVVRQSSFPAYCKMRPEDVRQLKSRERRGFFGNTADKAKAAAYAAAAQELHLTDADGKPKSLRERLQAANGHLPQFQMTRHDNALNALDALGEPVDDEPVDTSLWARVELDAQDCNGCGMCAMFCPTGALTKVEGKHAHDPYTMEFNCSACTGCDLCVDSCFKKALHMKRDVRPSQLMGFEPEVLKAKAPSQTFGGKRLV